MKLFLLIFILLASKIYLSKVFPTIPTKKSAKIILERHSKIFFKKPAKIYLRKYCLASYRISGFFVKKSFRKKDKYQKITNVSYARKKCNFQAVKSKFINMLKDKMMSKNIFLEKIMILSLI